MNSFFATFTAGLLSPENLAKFFAINNLVTGIGLQFAPDIAMKFIHDFEKSAANQEARLVGAVVISYGLLPFLTVIQEMDRWEAMAWSLVPIATHLLYRDVARSTKKSASYKSIAAATASTLLGCAYCLATRVSTLATVAAAWIPLLLLGTIAILQILFPGYMMQALELVDDKFSKKEPKDYRPLVITQGIGLHSLIYLAQFFALYYKGAGRAIEAVGFSALIIPVVVVPVCFVSPNLRLSGAPMAPMISFAGIHAFMAWKMLS